MLAAGAAICRMLLSRRSMGFAAPKLFSCARYGVRHSACPSLALGLCQTTEYPQLEAGHLQGLHKLLLHLQAGLYLVSGKTARRWVQAMP